MKRGGRKRVKTEGGSIKISGSQSSQNVRDYLDCVDLPQTNDRHITGKEITHAKASLWFWASGISFLRNEKREGYHHGVVSKVRLGVELRFLTLCVGSSECWGRWLTNSTVHVWRSKGNIVGLVLSLMWKENIEPNILSSTLTLFGWYCRIPWATLIFFFSFLFF